MIYSTKQRKSRDFQLENQPFRK